MTSPKGRIVLMGSGELTPTMVAVHKALLSFYGPDARATFLDTPAGFQLNADQIAKKAAAYFRRHVGVDLQVAAFQSRESTTPLAAEEAFLRLKTSDYILMGPGSPTYTVTQLEPTPIPEIFCRRLQEGACLTAASAAALTVGRLTLPVYEIYKAGHPLHWANGLDILPRFGLDLVVIPHWNNAEGGTHDTRFCFMGAPRLQRLEALLPEKTALLGVDEHTACILDLASRTMEVTGLGRVTLRHAGKEQIFEPGRPVPLDALHTRSASFAVPDGQSGQSPGGSVLETPAPSFWEKIHALEARFQAGLHAENGRAAAGALLELDRRLWEAHESLEADDVISQAREILREWMVLLGNRLSENSHDPAACLAPLVEDILALRRRFRDQEKWAAADALREVLHQSGVRVEDTPDGPRWRLVLRGAKAPEGKHT